MLLSLTGIHIKTVQFNLFSQFINVMNIYDSKCIQVDKFVTHLTLERSFSCPHSGGCCCWAAGWTDKQVEAESKREEGSKSHVEAR